MPDGQPPAAVARASLADGYGGLALILVAAAALRLHDLGTWSLWVDEVATAVFAAIQAPATAMAVGPPYDEDWRALVRVLSPRAASDDLVVAIGAFEGLALLRYGEGRLHPDIVVPYMNGNALQMRMAHLMKDAEAVRAEDLANAACARRRAPPSIWIAAHNRIGVSLLRPTFEASLHAAGARLVRTDVLGVLALDQWQGLACPIADTNMPPGPA